MQAEWNLQQQEQNELDDAFKDYIQYEEKKECPPNMRFS